MVWCKAYFDISSRLGVDHECDIQTDRQTDGRTDILLATAALHYVVRPKITERQVLALSADIYGCNKKYKTILR